jgi:hypothetical protein
MRALPIAVLALVLGGVRIGAFAANSPNDLNASLTGYQEIPTLSSAGTATFQARISPDEAPLIGCFPTMLSKARLRRRTSIFQPAAQMVPSSSGSARTLAMARQEPRHAPRRPPQSPVRSLHPM